MSYRPRDKHLVPVGQVSFWKIALAYTVLGYVMAIVQFFCTVGTLSFWLR